MHEDLSPLRDLALSYCAPDNPEDFHRFAFSMLKKLKALSANPSPALQQKIADWEEVKAMLSWVVGND